MRRRGVVLIAALFLMLFMAILGTHLFYLKMMEHRAGVLHKQELLAFMAAEAGLEDARLKLCKDALWPPMVATQRVYGYSDSLAWEGEVLALYRVALRPTGSRVVVTAWGVVGDVATPAAQRQVEAVFNRDTGRLEKFVDWGSL